MICRSVHVFTQRAGFGPRCFDLLLRVPCSRPVCLSEAFVPVSLPEFPNGCCQNDHRHWTPENKWYWRKRTPFPGINHSEWGTDDCNFLQHAQPVSLCCVSPQLSHLILNNICHLMSAGMGPGSSSAPVSLFQAFSFFTCILLNLNWWDARSTLPSHCIFFYKCVTPQRVLNVCLGGLSLVLRDHFASPGICTWEGSSSLPRRAGGPDCLSSDVSGLCPMVPFGCFKLFKDGHLFIFMQLW